MIYLQRFGLLTALVLLTGALPRPSAAADPIIVVEHFTNFR